MLRKMTSFSFTSVTFCLLLVSQCLLHVSTIVAEEPTKHQLEYAFKTGEFVHYKVSDASSYTTQKDEIKETAKNHSTAWRQYRVVSVDAAGEAVLELMIERVRLQTQFDESPPVVFDSADPKLQPTRFGKILNTVGKPMSRIRVNKQGKLLQVQNLFGKQPKEVDPTLNFLVVFPETALATGDSWTQNLEVEVAVTKTLKEKVKLLRKYTLDSVKEDIATLSLSTVLISKIRDPAVKVRLMQQTPSGTIQFDTKRHLLLSRELTTDGQVIGAFGDGTLVRATSERVEKLNPTSTAKNRLPGTPKIR